MHSDAPPRKMAVMHSQTPLFFKRCSAPDAFFGVSIFGMSETEKNIKDEDIDEYVFNNIYRNENKSLGDEFQNIMRDLINSIKNGEEEDILLNKNKYDKFVNDNKTILDSEKMKQYFQKRYN